MKTAFFFLILIALGSHAQYASNATFPEIVKTARDGVTAANRIADIMNDSIQLVPSALSKLEAIENRMKSMEDYLKQVSSPNYIISIVAGSATVAVSIVGVYTLIRHIAIRKNWCGVAEPYTPSTRAGTFELHRVDSANL